MRLNGLGVAMYLLMSGWLLLASAVRLMIELGTGTVDALPFVGVGLGLLALAGIGFGRVVDGHDEERHRSSVARQAASRAAADRYDPYD